MQMQFFILLSSSNTLYCRQKDDNYFLNIK
jgi:hypothetical protein